MADGQPVRKSLFEDIAELADVSIATVDRVLNDCGNMSARTDEKVLTTAKRLKLRPLDFLHYLHHEYFRCNHGADGPIPFDKWFGSFCGRTREARVRLDDHFLARYPEGSNRRWIELKFRTFGRTGWQVSEISFGAWQLGGDWGNVDDTQSINTLHYAFEKGINFVDTAELYGKGHSEEVVGLALKQWRGNKIYVATKAQPIQWPASDDDNPQMQGRFPPWYLRGCVERLQVERIDLFQLHSWMPRGYSELDWLETLNDLRREGKIDHIGISLRDFRPDEGVDLAHFGLVDSLQVVFNLFEQRPAQNLFPAGRKTNMAFIARVPLDSGSLIGSWTKDTYATWEPGSQPHTMFRDERFGETMWRVDELKKICAPYYPTLAEAAIRYVLSEPQLSTLIPGMKNRTEVDMNIKYSDGAAFPEELKSKLAPHGWIRNYYR
jgi:aryl-alcohol dehydrogenase-like predicted oxidoreductase